MHIRFQSYENDETGALRGEVLRARLAEIADPASPVEVHGITSHDPYALPDPVFRFLHELTSSAVHLVEGNDPSREAERRCAEQARHLVAQGVDAWRPPARHLSAAVPTH